MFFSSLESSDRSSDMCWVDNAFDNISLIQNMNSTSHVIKSITTGDRRCITTATMVKILDHHFPNDVTVEIQFVITLKNQIYIRRVYGDRTEVIEKKSQNNLEKDSVITYHVREIIIGKLEIELIDTWNIENVKNIDYKFSSLKWD